MVSRMSTRFAAFTISTMALPKITLRSARSSGLTPGQVGSRVGAGSVSHEGSPPRARTASPQISVWRSSSRPIRSTTPWASRLAPASTSWSTSAASGGTDACSARMRTRHISRASATAAGW